MTTPLPKIAEAIERLLNVARGCHDYSGGHSGEHYETFHHGVQTVINALESAVKNDPNDHQVNALESMGAAAIRARIAKEPTAPAGTGGEGGGK